VRLARCAMGLRVCRLLPVQTRPRRVLVDEARQCLDAILWNREIITGGEAVTDSGAEDAASPPRKSRSSRDVAPQTYPCMIDVEGMAGEDNALTVN